MTNREEVDLVAALKASITAVQDRRRGQAGDLLTDPAATAAPAVAGGPQSEAGATPAVPASDTLPAAAGPGVYPDMPFVDYLADPVPGGSLSRSGARLLLPPYCPALYRWRQDHPEKPKKEFDFGHAAHLQVLGDGPELEVVDAPDWRTKAAREQRDAARAEGRVPILVADWEQVQEMAAAIKAHPIASQLLAPGAGTPEVTLIWRDEETGVMLRIRLDWLPNKGSGRLIVPEYKSARSAQTEEFARAAANYDYNLQAAWQMAGVRALGIADQVRHVFVAQDKEPPYLVNVIELDERAVRTGNTLMRWAIDLYQRCMTSGRWPGYAADVEQAALPDWYLARFGEA